MRPDLERRLRDARPTLPDSDASVASAVEARLLARYAAPGARRALRRWGWLSPGRLVAGGAAATVVAGVAVLVVASPWSREPEVRISLGGSGTTELGPTAQEPPSVPFDADDVPIVLRQMLGLPKGERVVPGTLRRRVRIDRREGTYQLWTYQLKDDLAAGDQPVIVGKGYFQGSPLDGCAPLDPDSVPIAQCVNSLGGDRHAVGGRVLPEVSQVEIDAAAGERTARVGFGYWLAVSDAPRSAPFQIVARDSAGTEIARVPGRDPLSDQAIERAAPEESAVGPTVPNLLGVAVPEARRSLESLGFYVREQTVVDSKSAIYEVIPASGGAKRRARVGEVVRQYPPAGVAMRRGRMVTLSGLDRLAAPIDFDGEVVPVDSPDVPKVVSQALSGTFGIRPTPGTLRRHLSVSGARGRYEIWSVRGRAHPQDELEARVMDPKADWQAVISVGPGMEGGGVASGPVDDSSLLGSDTFPLGREGGSVASAGGMSYGLAGREVASVAVLTADGERPASVGGGYWLVVHDPKESRPIGLIARDAAGNEVARMTASSFASADRRASLPTDDLPPGDHPAVPAVTPSFPPRPGVEPMDPATATARLESAGFKVRIRSTDTTGLNGADRVLGQWPEAGSSMPAGRTVLLDVSAPATPAPGELMATLAKAGPITVASVAVESVPAGLVTFGDDAPPPWIFKALQNPQRRAVMDVHIAGGTNLSSEQAPAESFVLWTPGHEGEAAAIAKRLGITRGASAEGLPASLFDVQPGTVPKGVTAATVLIVLGTRPLTRP